MIAYLICFLIILLFAYVKLDLVLEEEEKRYLNSLKGKIIELRKGNRSEFIQYFKKINCSKR